MNSKQKAIITLLLLFAALLSFKLFYLRYTPEMVIPISGYKVSIEMSVDGHGSQSRVVSCLPSANDRQEIFEETHEAAAFDFTIHSKNGNRFGVWQAENLQGQNEFGYSFFVKSQQVKFLLPDSLARPEGYEASLTTYLAQSELIQVGNPIIADTLAAMGLNRDSDILTAVKRVYDYTSFKMKNNGFSGKTDALTALKLTEASCNGKSRLFVAMMRTLGIPARLVGGLVLNPGKKRISHQWTEVFLGNEWVTFDPTNKYFAELPAHYLIFYYGDEAFFHRTRNLNFDYSYNIKSRLFPREDNDTLSKHPLNIMNAWSLFQSADLSVDLLRILLMIPIGAVVTIIFRNVIGVQTFGTFLPALIASSFRESGLFWGLAAFIFIIMLGAVLRTFLNKLKLLHTPKLSIILVFVVFALLGISAIGIKIGNMDMAHANLFPLALMAITIERFSIVTEDSGLKTAILIFANTLIVVVFCYLVINSLFLQTVVLAFPEVMLLVVAISIYLGDWVGLRISELIRFKRLIFTQ